MKDASTQYSESESGGDLTSLCSTCTKLPYLPLNIYCHPDACGSENKGNVTEGTITEGNVTEGKVTSLKGYTGITEEKSLNGSKIFPTRSLDLSFDFTKYIQPNNGGNHLRKLQIGRYTYGHQRGNYNMKRKAACDAQYCNSDCAAERYDSLCKHVSFQFSSS